MADGDAVTIGKQLMYKGLGELLKQILVPH